MEQYRNLIEWSARTLVDPGDAVRAHSRRMQQAAAELRFESAAKIRAYVNQLSQLGKGPYRHARLLKDFQFVSFQHGPREGAAKVFLIGPGEIREPMCLCGEPARPAETLRAILEACADRATTALDQTGTERIGIVAHHLFSPRQSQGVFLPLDQIDEWAIARAWRDLRKQSPQEPTEAEGVLKELQTL